MNNEGDDDQIRDDNRPIEHCDGIDYQLAHSGPGEDRLRHHRERKSGTKLKSEHRHDGDGDQFQYVVPQNGPFRKAHGACQFDCVG